MEESQPDLIAYASVPIAFEVRETLRVVDERATGSGVRLEPAPVARTWTKDYDALDGGPAAWPDRFDVSRWTFFAARCREDGGRVNGSRVGGAVVVFRAPGIDMLRGRDEVAVLWDIRVAPRARGQGVGAALLWAAETNVAGRGARWLEVETQHINAPACHFYARHGFRLSSVDPNAYRDLPKETQLIWSKELGSDPDPPSGV